MYKWLVITIISIFVLAIVLRQCVESETPIELSDASITSIDIKDTVFIYRKNRKKFARK